MSGVATCRCKKSPAALFGERGFSVVEVMVAMTLSLVLLAGVLFVVYTSKLTYNESERVARLQENGRAAVELMLRDMRAGGFRGCTQTVPFTNALNTTGALMWNFGSLVQGFDYASASTWSPALDALVVSPLDGSDVVAVRTVRADMPVLTTDAAMVDSDDDISITRDSDDLEVGRTLLISDCNAAAVFAVSTYSPSGTSATITHTASVAPVGVGPGNATADIGFAFQAGAQVVPVDTVVYYLRASDTMRDAGANPALWRIVGASDPEELIEGVERMQILYGEDTDGDRLVNTYVAASGVTNWSRVISVSFAILIRSVEPNARERDTRTYSLLGTTAGPFNDFYERTLYTTTVALRNNTA